MIYALNKCLFLKNEHNVLFAFLQNEKLANRGENKKIQINIISSNWVSLHREQMNTG